MHCHFFGNSDSPLFGVYHAPRKSRKQIASATASEASAKPAVLLCPPIGHEYLRTHWSLRRRASALSRAGYPVLRFDYFGFGDSAGTSEEVTSIQTWIENIQQAKQNLIDESGTQDVVVIGLRIGGLLAAEALRQDEESNPLPLVVWDPIAAGNEYVDSLRVMHEEMLDLWYCKLDHQIPVDCEELLGSLFQHSVIQQLEELAFADSISDTQQQFTTLVGNSEQLPFLEAFQDISVVQHQDRADWDLLSQIETAWLPSDGPSKIEAVLGDLLPPFATANTRPKQESHSHTAVIPSVAASLSSGEVHSS